MKYLLFVTIYGVTLLTTIIGCKPIEDEFPKTREEILRPKTWVLKDMVLGPPGGAATSAFNTVPVCVRDDEFRFRSENRLYINTGLAHCDSSELDDYKGSWTLKNDVILEMYSDYDTAMLMIEELDENNMRAYIDDLSGTLPLRYTFIFSAK